MHNFKNKSNLFLNDIKADNGFFLTSGLEIRLYQSMDNEEFSESQQKQMSSFSFSSWHH